MSSMGRILNASSPLSKIVMAVDPFAATRVELQSVVQAGGFTFLGASGADECLALTNRIVPRFILIDIDALGEGGFETCRRLRERPELKGVPIGFVTAGRSEAALRIKEGLGAGGNDFILKPFERDKLIERVRHWASRRV